MLRTKSQLIGAIKAALGGRAAEEVVFGDISTGASNDIEKVTSIARQMVTTYGMSKELGPLMLGKKEEMVFLGKEISDQRNYGDDVADKIDAEIAKLVGESYQEAIDLLIKNRLILDRLANYLIEEETAEGDVLIHLLDDPLLELSVSEDV
jgi:cell division protease FtsH